MFTSTLCFRFENTLIFGMVKLIARNRTMQQNNFLFVKIIYVNAVSKKTHSFAWKSIGEREEKVIKDDCNRLLGDVDFGSMRMHQFAHLKSRKANWKLLQLIWYDTCSPEKPKRRGIWNQLELHPSFHLLIRKWNNE